MLLFSRPTQLQRIYRRSICRNSKQTKLLWTTKTKNMTPSSATVCLLLQFDKKYGTWKILAPYGVRQAFSKLSFPVDTNHLPHWANFNDNTQLSCKCN